MDRKTVSKRLADALVEPTDKRNGYDVYRLRDAVKALFGLSTSRQIKDSGEADFDPTKLAPTDRRSWYDSEHKRVDLEVKQRQLIPAAEVEDAMGDVVKVVVQKLDTLPDILERECALPPKAIDRVIRTIDALREDLYQDLSAADDPRDAERDE